MRGAGEQDRTLEALVGKSAGRTRPSLATGLAMTKAFSSARHLSDFSLESGNSSDLQDCRDKRSTLLLRKQHESMRKTTLNESPVKIQSKSKRMERRQSRRNISSFDVLEQVQVQRTSNDEQTNEKDTSRDTVPLPSVDSSSKHVSRKKKHAESVVRERRGNRGPRRPTSSNAKPGGKSKSTISSDKLRSASLPVSSMHGHQKQPSKRNLSSRTDCSMNMTSHSRSQSQGRNVNDMVNNSSWTSGSVRKMSGTSERKTKDRMKESGHRDRDRLSDSMRKSSRAATDQWPVTPTMSPNMNGRVKGLRRRTSTRRIDREDSPLSLSSPSVDPSESTPQSGPSPMSYEAVTPYSVRKNPAIKSNSMSYSDYVMMAASSHKTPTTDSLSIYLNEEKIHPKSAHCAYGAGMMDRGPRIPNALPASLLKIPFDNDSTQCDSKQSNAKHHDGKSALQSLGKSVAKSMKKLSIIAAKPKVSPKPSSSEAHQEETPSPIPECDKDNGKPQSTHTLSTSTLDVSTDMSSQNSDDTEPESPRRLLSMTSPPVTLTPTQSRSSKKVALPPIQSAHARSNPGYASEEQEPGSRSVKSARPKTIRRGRRMEYLMQLAAPPAPPLHAKEPDEEVAKASTEVEDTKTDSEDFHDTRERSKGATKSKRKPTRRRSTSRKNVEEAPHKPNRRPSITSTYEEETPEPKAATTRRLSRSASSDSEPMIFHDNSSNDEALSVDSNHSYTPSAPILHTDDSGGKLIKALQYSAASKSPFGAMKQVLNSRNLLGGSGSSHFSISAPSTPEPSIRRLPEQLSMFLSTVQDRKSYRNLLGDDEDTASEQPQQSIMIKNESKDLRPHTPSLDSSDSGRRSKDSTSNKDDFVNAEAAPQQFPPEKEDQPKPMIDQPKPMRERRKKERRRSSATSGDLSSELMELLKLKDGPKKISANRAGDEKEKRTRRRKERLATAA